MRAIELDRLQSRGIHPLHATEVHDVLPRTARRLAEGMDAAGLAEIVLRLRLAPLVGIQRAFLRLDPELLPRHQMDHRPPLGTERAVAAHPAGERLGLERELDRAAVATALVWLHYHFSWVSCLRPTLQQNNCDADPIEHAFS